jgi:hypothetical protein
VVKFPSEVEYVPFEALHFQLLPPVGPLQTSVLDHLIVTILRLRQLELENEGDSLRTPLRIRGIRLHNNITPLHRSKIPRSLILQFDCEECLS